MRERLDAPTERVPEVELSRLRDYLDRQRPLSLAVWVRHAQDGPGGIAYDHHTMLGMDEAAYARADLRALDMGIWQECPAPGWLDVFPLAEVDALREVGEVLWERRAEAGEGLDPLEFTLVVEATEPPPGATEAVAAAVRELRTVWRVECARVSLRKNGREIDGRLRFLIVDDELVGRDNAVERVSRAIFGLDHPDLRNAEVGFHPGAAGSDGPAAIVYEGRRGA